jgi:hypothetical protein
MGAVLIVERSLMANLVVDSAIQRKAGLPATAGNEGDTE